MKKLFALLLTLIMVLSLSACGLSNLIPGGKKATEESKVKEAIEDIEASNPGVKVNEDALNELVDDIKEADGGHGYTGSDGAALADVNADNYTQVALDVFGIEVSEADGWTLSSASSPNGVNNLTISATNANDGKAIMQTYFDRCLKICPDGVFQQNIDWDTFVISKGTLFTSFDDYYASEAMEMENFCNGMWLYDFNGHGVQFSYTYEDGRVDLSLTLMSNLKSSDSSSSSNSESTDNASGSIKGIGDLTVKSLKTNKDTYKSEEPIIVTVEWTGTPADDAWVGIIPADVPHGDEKLNDEYDLEYYYIANVSSGDEITFETYLEPGDYTMRVHDTDSDGIELASYDFKVK